MATKKDGHGTTSPKIGTEGYFSYNIIDAINIGSFVCSEAGSGTYENVTDDTVKYEAFPDGGGDLVVRVNSPKGTTSASDTVVTITGAGDVTDPMTGTATIPSKSAMDQSFEVTPETEGEAFVRIDGVTITNGLLGDGFDIAILPDAANDVDLGHAQGVDAGAATGVKAIYDHLDKTHDKVIRGDRSLSVSQLLKNHQDGLLHIKNRSVCLKMEIKDDSGNVSTETYVWGTCQLAPSQTFPASAAEDDMTVAAEGTYGKLYVFS